VICKHRFCLSSRTVYCLTLSLICIYFLFDKWASQSYFQFKWAIVSFKSVVKRFITLTKTNAFTETLKFVSISKGFRSCFEKFALSSEQILKYFSDHGRTYLQFQISIVRVITPHSECQVNFLTLMIPHSVGGNRKCSSEIVQSRTDWKVHFQPLLKTQGSSESVT